MADVEIEIGPELKKMRRLRNDRTSLDNISNLFPSYIEDIAAARTIGELDAIDSELSPHYKLIHSWNFDPDTHDYLKSRIRKVKTLKELIENKREALAEGRAGSMGGRERVRGGGEGGRERGEEEMVPESTGEEDLDSILAVEERNVSPALHTNALALERPAQIPSTLTSPTLVDLLNFYRHNGLVGEEKTAILQTLGAIHGLCFGIESLSGSGKTYTLNIILDLLPKEYVYIIPQASDKAIMYDTEKVNQAKIIVVTELQKSANNKTVIEVLKDLGEGRTAERKVTKADRSGVEEQKIEAGKSIIYTLALENWFKKDRELERRYFQLYTDISEGQTRRILSSAAQKEYLTEEDLRIMSDGEILALKEHIRGCLILSPSRYINPFADSIIQNMPTNIKARSFINHYFNLIQASAKFHHRERLKEGGNIFVSLEDVYLISELYNEQFLKSTLRIPLAGEELLTLFDEERFTSSADVHKRLKHKKSPLTFPVVNDMLEELAEAGYLEKEDYDSRGDNYRKISDIKIIENKIDWQSVWESGLEIIMKNYPERAGAWIEAQAKDGRVSALDPLKGGEVQLAHYLT